ncbi:MAG: zinc ribbon domain-containing protein [Myxococcota bacterium]|nr:zinc ribbon domain-containing protein [Myxococcota bacterium]
MEERVESKGFFEMLWDCDHCDTKGLLGKSQRHCPNCGAKQNPDTRYFPEPGKAQRVDGHKYEGSDRTCLACNAPQSAKATNCTHCGAALDGASEVRGVVSAVAPKPKRKRWPIFAVIAGVFVVIFSIWYFFIRTKDEKMTVTAHRWERAIDIEEFADRDETAWQNEVPRDARMVTCHREERSSRRIKDGETCRMERVDRKDGTFEEVEKCRPKYRSEPVYDEKCRFTVRRWNRVDSVRLTGADLQPAWPSHVPPQQAVESLGARRAGARHEKLLLDFGKQTCEVSDAAWRKYKVGSAYTVEVRARSGEVVCKSL